MAKLTIDRSEVDNLRTSRPLHWAVTYAVLGVIFLCIGVNSGEFRYFLAAAVAALVFAGVMGYLFYMDSPIFVMDYTHDDENDDEGDAVNVSETSTKL